MESWISGFLLEPTITELQCFNTIDYFQLTSPSPAGAVMRKVLCSKQLWRILDSYIFRFCPSLGPPHSLIQPLGGRRENCCTGRFYVPDLEMTYVTLTQFLLVRIESYGCTCLQGGLGMASSGESRRNREVLDEQLTNLCLPNCVSWASHITSHRLSVHICKMGIITS